MVKEPEPTTFATEDPEMVPWRAEESTATFAGPPDAQPAMAFAISMKNLPRPVFSRNAPKRINRKINVEDTPSGIPNTPSVVKKRCPTICCRESPLCANGPGMYGPKKPNPRKHSTTMTIGSPTIRLAASMTMTIPSVPMTVSSGVTVPARRMSCW